MASIDMLPTEVLHCILDYLDNLTIYFSLQNVSPRFNQVVHDYDPYRSFNTIHIDCRNYNQRRAREVLDGLRQNRTLTLIYVRGINSVGINNLVSALREIGESLTTLDLRVNRIQDTDVQRLAIVLRRNKTLITLDLAGNVMGPKGAYYLAQALRENTTLRVLNVSFNQFGPRGAQQLAHTLRDNRALTKVDLQFNQVCDTGKRCVRQIVKNNTALQLLL